MTYIDPRKRAYAEEHGVPHASEGVIAEWHALAEAVCRELQHAGLPAYVELPGTPVKTRTGAGVSLDTIDGPAGGVHISWHAGESFTQLALGFMGPDRLDLRAPAIAHFAQVGALMDETIRSVLTFAGFRTRDAVELDSLASGTYVVGRQPRQWFIEYILTEGVLGLAAAVRSPGPSSDDSGEPSGTRPQGEARLTERGFRILAEGLQRLSDDDRREVLRVFRGLAGAMHSQDMALRGFWEADRSLLEIPQELCLPAKEPSAVTDASVPWSQVLATGYLALFGSIERAEEDTIATDEAAKILEACTGTLLRRLEQAPDEDRQELLCLFQTVVDEETEPAHKAFASGLLDAIALGKENG